MIKFEKYVRYDSENGKLLWIDNFGARAKKGNSVGTKTKKGYLRFRICGKNYMVHRVVWYLCTGKLPDFQIDHMDKNKENNKIENLRELTNAQNSQNVSKVRSNNKTAKYLGVSYSKSAKKYRATIVVNGKQETIGYFNNQEDAASAYLRRKVELHTYYHENQNSNQKAAQPLGSCYKDS